MFPYTQIPCLLETTRTSLLSFGWKGPETERDERCLETTATTNPTVKVKQYTLLCLKSHYYWPMYKQFRSSQRLFWESGAISVLKLKKKMGKKPHHLHVEAAQQQERIGLDSSQSLHHRQSRPKKRIKTLQQHYKHKEDKTLEWTQCHRIFLGCITCHSNGGTTCMKIKPMDSDGGWLQGCTNPLQPIKPLIWVFLSLNRCYRDIWKRRNTGNAGGGGLEA